MSADSPAAVVVNASGLEVAVKGASTAAAAADPAFVVTLSPNSAALPVTFSLPGNSSALPTMLSLNYLASIGAIVANVYKRAYTYTVPAGYNGYLIRFSSFQAEAAQSRIVAEKSMGTLNINTNAYTAGTAYTAPQWSGLIQADVTTGLSSGAGNVTVTVTYTNELGTASRTGTFSIPRGSAVGSRWDFTPQVGDLGVTSIQNLSVSPTLAAGAIKVLGFIQLGYHEDGGTSALETPYAPGATLFPSGTVIGIEHQGGTVSKLRRFDVLIQLLVA
jgi:hypothetical protein